MFSSSRGFICPPHLQVNPEGIGWVDGSSPGIYLAGQYTTRVFEPRLTFTRTSRFRSFGEGTHLVVLDDQDNFEITYGFAPAIADVLLEVAEQPWATGVTTMEIEIGGYPATRVDFVVGAPCFNRDTGEGEACVS